jgi:hypothetical protein
MAAMKSEVDVMTVEPRWNSVANGGPSVLPTEDD